MTSCRCMHRLDNTESGPSDEACGARSNVCVKREAGIETRRFALSMGLTCNPRQGSVEKWGPRFAARAVARTCKHREIITWTFFTAGHSILTIRPAQLVILQVSYYVVRSA